MTSIFEGQPPKTRPKLQPKQGSFGFQVYIQTGIIQIRSYCDKCPLCCGCFFQKTPSKLNLDLPSGFDGHTIGAFSTVLGGDIGDGMKTYPVIWGF